MKTEQIRRVDSRNMYDRIAQFPQHFREARGINIEGDVVGVSDGIESVVVAGMGGSAIGGDLLKSYAYTEAKSPISVVRGYTLPAIVNDRTLLVVSSFSGHTEETLAVMEQGLQRGSRIVCIASGGEVLDRAGARRLPYIRIPGGMPPRAALGYSFGALLNLANRIGLISVTDTVYSEADALLSELTGLYGDPSGNEALTLAEALAERLPVVYSGSELLDAVGVRLRCQINENSKRLAYGNSFPELNHNEIMGWEDEGTLPAKVGVIVLRDRDDHPRVQQRIDVTREIVSERAGYWTEVWSRGESRLARMLSLVNFGDWVSLYLAVLLGADPTPIGFIDRLKQAL